MRKSILNLRCLSAGSQDRYFVPKSEYRCLVTRSVVEAEVEQCPSIKPKRTIIDIIDDGGTHTFGILLLCSRPELIENFIQADHMQERTLDSLIPYDLEALHLLLDDTTVAADFFKWQWEFCCPDFSRPLFPRRLADQTVLPFLKNHAYRSGAHGRIYKVKIHQDYRPSSEGTSATVSVLCWLT